VQDKSKTTGKSGSERDNKKIRYLILSGSLLPVLLAGIISHVTASALGEVSEARIQASQVQLEIIVSKFIDTLQDLALGTEIRPAGLMPLIETHLSANPARPDNREVFEWLKTRQTSMSDFRHDRIDELILEARKDYQENLSELQNAKQTYREHIDSLYAGFWLRRNGYPTIELGAGGK